LYFLVRVRESKEKAMPKARPDGGNPVRVVSFMAKPNHLYERWYERVHTDVGVTIMKYDDSCSLFDLVEWSHSTFITFQSENYVKYHT